MAEQAAERAFDHLVLCVDDLDAARDAYEALGFTTTPKAVHPFGTGNVLVQLQGCFLELLAVVDPQKITGPASGHFSFGDYTRRFLGGRQGFSMLALRTRDAAADRAAFAAAGLDTYPLFEFERQAKAPDGSAVTVGFSLAFVTDPRMPEAVFFCCRHRHPPEFFWKPAYQNHANRAVAVREVIMVADDPHGFAEFFARLQGETAVHAGKDTLTVRFGPDRIVMLTPGRFAERFPGTAPTQARSAPGFAGFQVEVPDIGRLRERLHHRDVRFREDESRRLRIDPEHAFGTVIEFVESPA
jgi:catechol 2,3-dioxygenase-like lactoylglutathione lyase family enzyme